MTIKTGSIYRRVWQLALVMALTLILLTVSCGFGVSFALQEGSGAAKDEGPAELKWHKGMPDLRFLGANKEGLTWFFKDQRFGFMDIQGRVVIPCQYDAVKDFEQGVAVVSQKDMWGAVDKTGKVIIPLSYQSLQRVEGRFFLARLDGKYQLLSLKGEVVRTFSFENLSVYEDNSLATYDLQSNQLHVLNLEGKLQRKINYANYEIYDMSNKDNPEVVLSKEDQYWLVDPNKPQSPLATFKCDIVFYYAKPYVIGGRSNPNTKWVTWQYLLFDLKGNVLTTKLYDYLSIFDAQQGTFEAMEGQLMGLIDRTGKTLVPAQYDDLIGTKSAKYPIIGIAQNSVTFFTADYRPAHTLESARLISNTEDAIMVVSEGRLGVMPLSDRPLPKLEAQGGGATGAGDGVTWLSSPVALKPYNGQVQLNDKVVNLTLLTDGQAYYCTLEDLAVVAKTNNIPFTYKESSRGISVDLFSPHYALNESGLKPLVQGETAKQVGLQGTPMLMPYTTPGISWGEESNASLRSTWDVWALLSTVMDFQRFSETMEELLPPAAFLAEKRIFGYQLEGAPNSNAAANQSSAIKVYNLEALKNAHIVEALDLTKAANQVKLRLSDNRLDWHIADEKPKASANTKWYSALVPYSLVDGFQEGFAIVSGPNKATFINAAGVLLKPFIYDQVSNFTDGYALVVIDGAYGVIDKTGKQIIPMDYRELYYDGNRRWVARKNDLYGLLDANGKLAMPMVYEVMSELSEGLRLVSSKQLRVKGYVDAKGKLAFILPKDVEPKGNFKNGLARVIKSGKRGFINTKGKLVIPCSYDKATDFIKGIALVERTITDAKKGTKAVRYAIIDTKGKLLTQWEYEGLSALTFKDGSVLCLATKNGRTALLSAKGKALTPFIYDAECQVVDNHVVLSAEDKTVIYDSKGKQVAKFTDGESVRLERQGYYILLDDFGTELKHVSGKTPEGTEDADYTIGTDPIIALQRNNLLGIMSLGKQSVVPVSYSKGVQAKAFSDSLFGVPGYVVNGTIYLKPQDFAKQFTLGGMTMSASWWEKADCYLFKLGEEGGKQSTVPTDAELLTVGPPVNGTLIHANYYMTNGLSTELSMTTALQVGEELYFSMSALIDILMLGMQDPFMINLDGL